MLDKFVCQWPRPQGRSKLSENLVNATNMTQDFEIDTVGVSTIELRGTIGGRQYFNENRQTRVLLYKY